MKKQLIPKILTQLDFFSYPIRLTFKSQSSYSTIFGNVLTYLVVAFGIITCMYFGEDMYKRTNPKIIQTESYVENPQPYYLNINNFPLIMGIEDDQTWQPIFDERVFTVEITQVRRQKYFNQETREWDYQYLDQPLKTERCNLQIDKYDQDLQKESQIPNINKYYCLNFSSIEDPLRFEGYWYNDYFQQINIDYKICQNTTENQNCASPEEIQEKLKFAAYSINHVDVTVNMNSYEKPFNYHFVNQYELISPNYSKKLYIYYEEVISNSDVGLIFDSFDSKHSIKLLGYDVTFQPNVEDSMFHCEIYLTQKQSFYQRTYKKIQDVLAEVGGLTQAIICIAYFFVQPFIKLNFYQELVNEIFSMEQPPSATGTPGPNKLTIDQIDSKDVLIHESDQKKGPPLQRKMSSVAKEIFHNLKTKKRLSIKLDKDSEKYSPKQRQKAKKQIADKLQQFLEPQQDGFKFKLCDYLQYLCPFITLCYRKRKKNVTHAMKKIKNRFDSIFLHNKLIELDKLKLLLLNEEQLKLFNMIPKPILNLDSEQNELEFNQQFNFYDDNKSILEKAASGYEAFKSISRQITLSQIDQKLLKTLDPQIKSFYQEMLSFDDSTNNLTIELQQIPQTNNQLDVPDEFSPQESKLIQYQFKFQNLIELNSKGDSNYQNNN